MSLCNHQILQFPYLHLRSLCLPLSDLILLSLVLQHSCIYQSFWALASFNSVFTLWTFRPTLQNLQRFLIFPMFLSSTTNLLMFSAKLRLNSLLLIIIIISKSIWKKMLNLWLALYTLFQHPSKIFNYLNIVISLTCLT